MSVWLMMLLSSLYNSFYTLKIIAFFLLFSEEPPNLVTLLRFPTSKGYINLTKKVGDNFKTFGTLLLKDESGAIMSGLERTYNGRVVDITRAVFTMWITSSNFAFPSLESQQASTVLYYSTTAATLQTGNTHYQHITYITPITQCCTHHNRSTMPAQQGSVSCSFSQCCQYPQQRVWSEDCSVLSCRFPVELCPCMACSTVMREL